MNLVHAQPRRKWVGPAWWTGVGTATFLGAFVLPFAFPLRTPVMSAVYTAGGNNRVGTLAVAGISALVVVVLAYAGDAKQQPAVPYERLPLSLLLLCMLLTLAFTTSLGFVVARARVFWGDAGYFLTQLRAGIDFHQPIYRGFEFAYGPLLFGWPAAFIRGLAPLGVPRVPAYLLSLAVMQVLGLALLFYTIDALPMRRSLKIAALLALTLGSLTPMLGLNYALFRFALPPAALVLLSRQRSVARAVLVAACGEALALATSPELGISFAAGALALACFRLVGRPGSPRWLWIAAAALGGGGVFVVGFGSGPFLTLRSMAGGGFNLLLEPLPHVLVLLVGLVGLAPIAVARALRSHCSSDSPSYMWIQPNAGMLMALYAAALAMLPAAFGRSDPLHVFFNGLGILLLSLVGAEDLGRGWRKGAVALMTGLALWTFAVNASLYRQPLVEALRALHNGAQTPELDPSTLTQALACALGDGRVAVPRGAPESLIAELARRGQLQPGYFVDYVNMNDAESEWHEVEEMRRADFALVPSSGLLFTEPIDNTLIKRRLRLGFVYPQRREPYYVGGLLSLELEVHWGEVGRFGAYTLYRRLS